MLRLVFFTTAILRPNIHEGNSEKVLRLSLLHRDFAAKRKVR